MSCHHKVINCPCCSVSPQFGDWCPSICKGAVRLTGHVPSPHSCVLVPPLPGTMMRSWSVGRSVGACQRTPSELMAGCSLASPQNWLTANGQEVANMQHGEGEGTVRTRWPLSRGLMIYMELLRERRRCPIHRQDTKRTELDHLCTDLLYDMQGFEPLISTVFYCSISISANYTILFQNSC